MSGATGERPLLAKPVKVPENDISRGKSTIVVGPDFCQ